MYTPLRMMIFLFSVKVYIWQLTHFVKQRCLGVVFKCARKYSSSTLFHSLDDKYWNIDAWNRTLTVNLWIKIQLKRSHFVLPMSHIAPAVISCETFPALLVSEESSVSLKFPSVLGSRGKKRCLNGMISRLFERIIWRETFAKRRRKGYFIVGNSTLFETNVIFSPWTKQVMNLNLLGKGAH